MIRLILKVTDWVTPDNAHQRWVLNLWLGWLWFGVGVVGVANYIWKIGPPFEQSVAVLFFISIYANFISHLSTAQGSLAEEKIEQNTGGDTG